MFLIWSITFKFLCVQLIVRVFHTEFYKHLKIFGELRVTTNWKMSNYGFNINAGGILHVKKPVTCIYLSAVNDAFTLLLKCQYYLQTNQSETVLSTVLLFKTQY